MKTVNKVLLILIGIVLSYWAVMVYAADTELMNLPELAIGNGDILLYGAYDVNGVMADYRIPHEELMAYWTGSTAVTTLGTIATGTWNASFSDAALTAIDAGTWTGAASITTLGDVTTGSINKIAADESADGTLDALGKVHVRGDEDRYSFHFGAGGEIAGEATMSALFKITATFDPGAWYDSSAYLDLGPILAKQWPNGVIIDYWETTCHLNPDVEMDVDLCYSVNSFDLADPNVVDIMDTTNGISSEDTDANINGGAAIPAGVYLYLRFGADPEGTCVMFTFTALGHGEED